MLETLDKTNIGNINLDEPQRGSGLPFDVERDITRSDWDSIFDYAALHAYDRATSPFIIPEQYSFLAYTKLLSPSRFQDQFDKHRLDPARQLESFLPGQVLFRRDAVNILLHSDSLNYDSISSQTLALCRSLFTTKALFSGGNDIYKNSWPILEQVLRIYGGNQFVTPLEVPSALIALRIAYPGKFHELPEGSSGVMEAMEDRIKYYKEIAYGKDEAPFKFMSELANFKILANPLIFKLRGFLDDRAWKIMRDRLVKTRRMATIYPSGWIEFAVEAFYMKVLAADEIQITNQGLEFIYSEPKTKLTLLTPDLPEVRKF